MAAAAIPSSSPATQPTKPTLSTAWREARELVIAHRWRLIAGLGLLGVNLAASLVLPYNIRRLTDHVVAQHRPELIPWIAVEILGAAAVQGATSFALAQLLGIAAQRAINDLRCRVHRHVLALPISRFDATQSGQLITRIMNDAEGVRNLVGTGIVQLVGGLVTAVVVLAILLSLNWQLTLAIAVLLGGFGVVMAVTFRRLRPLFRERQKLNSEISGLLGQVLQGVRVVKVFTAEDRLQQRFTRETMRLFDLVRRTMTGVSGISALTVMLLGVAGAVLVVIGGQAMTAGTMTTGDFLMYIFLVGLLIAPVGQLASIGTQITEAFSGLDRIRELTSQPGEPSGDVRCPHLEGRVELRGVGFAYDAGGEVLSDIDFVAEAGRTVALVGPSGSGKTTLVALVMAFHRPQRGSVAIDGLDLATLDVRSYRSQLGVVLQDNWLLDGTVSENLLFANPEATPDQLTDACRAAAAEGFIAGLPHGMETIVGERGVRLSGGQRQRLAIARALLADPRILVLDEATSALDSESEAEIQEALRRLRAGRTTFVIAHRLSTIRDADCILVLEGGRIVERGRHDELLAGGGLYQRLHERQFRTAADRHVNPGEELRPIL